VRSTTSSDPRSSHSAARGGDLRRRRPTDGTFSALTRLHNSEQNVRVVRLRRNFGKATALVAGFDQAHGETVVTIDGDLQDDPAEIPRLLAKLDEGFDLVTGWKTHRRDPISRRLLSRLFNRVTSAFSACACTT
jgi:dolichol-phosphate mannosyltransferase